MVMPRSLKEQVGLTPSYLSHNSKSPPMARTKLSARTSGVFPSLREMTGVLVGDGQICAIGVNDAAPAIA